MGSRTFLVVVVAVALVAAGCAVSAGAKAPGDPAVTLRVLDRAGAPIAGAEVRSGGAVAITDIDGTARLAGDGPLSGRVDASGFLPEPFAVAPPGGTVAMWRREGPDGAVRSALHFGGDTMLGRRYLTPIREGTAVVDPNDPRTARGVVASLGPLFAAADLSTVNVESVVGDVDAADGAPGKRYLIASPPVMASALGVLGVDVAVLGNNHSYDFGPSGVATTIATLRAAGIAVTGASVDGSPPAPAWVTVPAGDVATLSYTTTNGDFVNDQLPVTGEVTAADEGTWIGERRDAGRAGFPGWPTGPVTAGDLWRWFRRFEAKAPAADVAAAWTAVTTTFPELQDWVARRGHGGAQPARPDMIAADVAAVSQAGARFVIVQIHGGFQYADGPSGFSRAAAYAAIDAGADLVVAHHPHVLQGVERYRGKLIVHSLGNLVFDQDLLRTFASAFLRVVIDDRGRVLEARFLPVWIEGYRPVPAVGTLADRIWQRIRWSSAIDTEATRLPDRTVGMVPSGATSSVTVDDGGRIVPAVESDPETVVAGAVPLRVVGDPVVRVVAADPGTSYGVDLLGIGSFDDDLADGVSGGAPAWVPVTPRRVGSEPVDAAGGRRLRLAAEGRRTIVRSVGRIPVPAHRIFAADGRPLDGDPWYTFAAVVSSSRDTTLTLRLAAYRVMDADPLRDPNSELVRSVAIPVRIPAATGRTVAFRIPAAVFAGDGDRTVDAVLPYLEVTTDGRGTVTVDDVRFLEWRDLPPAVGRVVSMEAIQGPDGAEVTIVRPVPVSGR